MANQYDTNLKLQAIADAIGNSQSSGLISALEDIADAVAGGGGGSSAGLVSDNFSETDTYDLGDYCIHNNTLYVCINAITTPGSWDLSDWQATNAGIQLSSLNSALEWKNVGEAFGNTNINLPADWRELSVVARYGTSNGLQSQTVPFRLTKLSKGFTSAVGSGGIESQVFINNDATTISLIYFAVSGTVYTATSKIYVWYR